MWRDAVCQQPPPRATYGALSFEILFLSQMRLKIEGRGNGIKTNIVNLNDIADDLRVPPLYALKFLGIEHGSQVKMEKTGTGVTAIVNGNFTEPQLRTTLDK